MILDIYFFKVEEIVDIGGKVFVYDLIVKWFYLIKM